MAPVTQTTFSQERILFSGGSPKGRTSRPNSGQLDMEIGKDLESKLETNGSGEMSTGQRRLVIDMLHTPGKYKNDAASEDDKKDQVPFEKPTSSMLELSMSNPSNNLGLK